MLFNLIKASSLLISVLMCLMACSSISITNSNKTTSTPKNMALAKQFNTTMVLVKGGSFQRGSSLKTAMPRELPIHTVSLDDFYIQKTEVTQAQFEAVMGWNYSYFQCATCPVNNISWTEMQLFIDKLNELTGASYRFPTEAEWEFAARGGNNSNNYKFSGSNHISDVAWYSENAKRKLHPVAQKKPNELGLYDMTGNVWEFVKDDMSRKAYQHAAAHNPIYTVTTKKGKKLKVLRGSGYEFSAEESDVFKRDGATNNVRLPDVGFRLAITKLD